MHIICFCKVYIIYENENDGEKFVYSISLLLHVELKYSWIKLNIQKQKKKLCFPQNYIYNSPVPPLTFILGEI